MKQGSGPSFVPRSQLKALEDEPPFELFYKRIEMNAFFRYLDVLK